jgi:hypothetical protein
MLVGLVLVALVLLAAASRHWGLPGAVALAAVSVLWLLVNHPVEGAVLWSVAPGRGLTAMDLAGLTGLGIAVLRGWRAVTGGTGVGRGSTRRRPDGGEQPPR